MLDEFETQKANAACKQLHLLSAAPEMDHKTVETTYWSSYKTWIPA